MNKISINNLNITQKQQSKNKHDLSFGGGEAVVQVLNYLDTNQFVGATLVDAGSMVIPRSVIDFSRGTDAGTETVIRETSTMANNTFIGLYGVGAAWLLSRALNEQFGIKAHKIFVNDENLDILSQLRDKHGDISKSDANLKAYLNEIFSNTKAFNPEFSETSKIDEKGYVNIDTKTREDVVEKFAQELKGNSDNPSKESKAYLKALIANSTGSEKNFKIEHGTLISNCSLDDLIDNVYKISKIFMNSKVAEAFKNGNLADNIFIKGLKKLNKRTAALGLAVSAVIGLSLQPANMYLTKRKTGKSGFVGVENKEPDKSNSFKILKYGIGALGALAILKSIGKFREIPGKIQFKGFIPTMEQFKLVYGATLVSRVLSSRDKHELRETTIKDTLGFASWLILGGFVSKLTAAGFEKMAKFKNDKFIRYNAKENGEGWFKWLTKSSLVSREEVLYSALKKAGISTIKEINGKKVALTFKEMLKKAPLEARTKIRYLALIQFAGYLYSGLALGIGIPKLNIAITKHFEKKHKAEEANSK